MALAEEVGLRPLVARCHLGFGLLGGPGRRRPGRREHLERAAAIFHDLDMPYWSGQAEAALTGRRRA